jgi:hypothetical protein
MDVRVEPLDNQPIELTIHALGGPEVIPETKPDPKSKK